VHLVERQVRCFNLFDEIDLLSFRQSGVIEKWFDEFGENRYDAK
jgi:hypothetical protein